MLRPIALVTLWFLTGWMCGAMVAFALALPTWIAPAVAVLAAACIGLWDSRRQAAKRVKASTEPSPALPTVIPNA